MCGWWAEAPDTVSSTDPRWGSMSPRESWPVTGWTRDFRSPARLSFSTGWSTEAWRPSDHGIWRSREFLIHPATRLKKFRKGPILILGVTTGMPVGKEKDL